MEYFFACPYCGENISVILELSVRKQEYVEDCEVCCCPIEISFTTDGDKITLFKALKPQ